MSTNQEIIYKRDGQELSRVVIGAASSATSAVNFDDLVAGLAQYVRAHQPFVTEGVGLSIPLPNATVWRTQAVTAVKKEQETISFTTLGSTYTIHYMGIDLGQMLRDGKGQGVNATSLSHPVAPFPCL